MRRLLVAAFLGAGVSWSAPTPLVAMPRQAANAKRLSVLNDYFLLPYIGNGSSPGELKRDLQECLRARYKPIIDLRHDYIRVQPDSTAAVQIAVFRGGADVVAYSAPDYKSDYNHFALFKLQRGHLRDVKSRLLPVPVRSGSFLYELPRLGTTIHVFTFDLEKQSHHPAFDLQWRAGCFVKVGLKRATH